MLGSPALKGKIAFRGGTAINKLLFKQALRYSEDIDLVQIQPEPAHRRSSALCACSEF
jgi:predicted nucleotidyltransferase component of viral defense system